jgi:addiction module HigA family antidote
VSHARGEPDRPPTHPGYVVRLELEELGMTVSEMAERLGVARPTLSQLVNERKRVSPEMALRLGRFFGNGTEIWVNLQARYDRWEIEHDPRALREAERVEPVHA